MKTFSMGMNKDTELLAQPEGTYRDALNINLNYKQGSVVNEEGVSRMLSTDKFTVCGYSVLDDDRIVLFGQQQTDTLAADGVNYTYYNQIKLLFPREDYSIVLYEDNLLNFQTTHRIQTTNRKNQAGEVLVYFTDGYFKEGQTGIPTDDPYLLEYNPPRVFNVDKQYERVTKYSDPVTRLYGRSRFNADNLRLTPYIGPRAKFGLWGTNDNGTELSAGTEIDGVPTGRGPLIETGGALKCGAYYMAIAYEDDEGQTTNYFEMSPPVYISSGPELSLPTTAITGGTGALPTNKSIVFRIDVPENVLYNKIKPAIVAKNDETTTAFSLPSVQINPGSLNRITYTGLEGASTIAVEDVVIDDSDYIVAQSITQQNNRLYLGNVKTNKDIGYQGFANQIQLETVTQRVNNFNPRIYDTAILNYGYSEMFQEYRQIVGRSFKTDGFEDVSGSSFNITSAQLQEGLGTNGYPDPEMSTTYNRLLKELMQVGGVNETKKGYKGIRLNHNMRGYKRGEVYAFYISFVMKDGTESYAYHIPGRETLSLGENPFNSSYVKEYNSINNPSDPSKWPVLASSFPLEFQNASKTTRVCDVYDTTDHTRDPGDHVTPVASTTSYWENKNEKYPSIPDFEIMKTVDTATGLAQEDAGATPLAGQNVRHHKMPSNHSESVPGIVPSADVDLDFIKEQAVVVPGDGGDQTNTNPRQSEPMKVIEGVNILGVKLKNIKIPKYIFDQIQGYKVYYAKRKPEDKTILGQSLVIPAHPRFASSPEQSVVQAKKGPYYRGWYLYGGVSGNKSYGVTVPGSWRGGDSVDNALVANPVFTFHDYTMLRRKSDLSSATHISAQYGVVFRHFLGGPGQFVPPCDYEKLKYAPNRDLLNLNSELNSGTYVQGITWNNNGVTEGKEILDVDRECTVLPSSGWVSTELRNTVSYTQSEGITGKSYVVDISDNVRNTSFKLQDGNFDPDADSLENYQLGRITGQEDDDDTDQGPNVEAYRLSRLQRVRAYFTGMFIGTAYVNPYTCLTTNHIIKGADTKFAGESASINSEYASDTNIIDNVSSTKTGNFLNLTIAPKSLTYIEGDSTTKLYNSNAFMGATFIYNRGGESSILIGLTSGLPYLRGHLPRWNEWAGDTSTSYSFAGLTQWSAPQNYYFPDAPDTSHPYGGLGLHWEWAGGTADPLTNRKNENTPGYPNRYDFKFGRGLNFAMLPYKADAGMPMAWLVNLCSIKTDVFQPFDRQDLVWTGYYVQIDTEDDTVRSNYYAGIVDSPNIFGGDTYIAKYNFRTTSQSYGHCFFRLNRFDAGIKNIQTDDPDLNQYAVSGYHAPGITASGNYPGALNSSIFYSQSNSYKVAAESGSRFQGDVPLSIGGLSNSYGFTNEQIIWRLSAAQVQGDYQNNEYDTRNQITVAALQENSNWKQGTVDPVSSLFEFMVESEDNIEFRYSNPLDEGTRFLGPATAKQIIFAPPTNNMTKTDNLLYSEHYSAVQDLKVTIPLPTSSRLKEVDTFSIRVARSTVDSGSLADGYRKFKALDYKDIDSNRGEIQNMFSLTGQLYIHTKRALFLTRGKEELQLSAVNAFVGSGDIFTQDPDEVGQSSLGMGGTDSRHAHVTTDTGHFYINRRDRAVYSISGGQIQRISDSGMQTWFRDNLEFEVKKYGIDLDSPEVAATGIITDSTTSKFPAGFTLGYDPKYKRVLITKREPIPTDEFITQYNAGNIKVINNIPTIVPGTTADFCQEFVEEEEAAEQRGQAPKLPLKNDGTQFCGPIGFGNPKYFKQSGWTVSYYPEKGVWGSRHSYLPDLYMYTSTDMFSVSEDERCETCRIRLWKHGNPRVPGGFYGETYNSEIEVVENTAPAEAKLFSSVFYWIDSYKENSTNSELDRKTNPGFTSFYVYNANQISGIGETINYLSNARMVDRMWRINDFRDLAKQETITEGSLISNKPNVSGLFTSQVVTNQQNVSMFLEEGKVNPDFVDTGKSWFNQGKFMDHYLVIRLINDNSSTNLVHLHGAGANFRKSYR